MCVAREMTGWFVKLYSPPICYAALLTAPAHHEIQMRKILLLKALSKNCSLIDAMIC